MSMTIGSAGQSWQSNPIPRHDDLQQKLVQEQNRYEGEIAQLSSADEEANRGQINEDYQKLAKVESKLAQISSQTAPSAVNAYQQPPITDEEMNRRFGSAYSVEISGLQDGRFITSSTPEVEAPSHL